MAKYTSWEEAEFRAQRRQYRSKNGMKKKKDNSFKDEDLVKALETELRMRFLIDEHEGVGSGDKSVKALKQFCNFLGNKASKNTAGGNRFRNRNDNPEMRKENELIQLLTVPVACIRHILVNEYIDYQQLLDIKIYIDQINENLATAIFGLMEIPFYQEDSGFMNGAGHNVAFKDVMIQLLLDANNNVYGDLSNRIESTVSIGRDAFSYRIY